MKNEWTNIEKCQKRDQIAREEAYNVILIIMYILVIEYLLSVWISGYPNYITVLCILNNLGI